MSSTVLSIDVGIKNLSFCLLRVGHEIEILKWNTINLNEPSVAVSTLTEPKQTCTTKVGCKLKPCYAYYTVSGTQYTCKRHYKNTPDIAPRHVFDEKPAYISRMMKSFTIEKLRDFCKSTSRVNTINDAHSIDKIKTKTELREKAAEILKTTYMYPIEIYDACMNMDLAEKNTVNPPVPSTPSKNSASTVSLVFVGYNLMKAFDELFYTTTSTTDAAHHIDTVVIENQISPIANRMKTVQGMITQYFLMRGVDKSNIIYYSSVQKLKVAPYHFVFHTENEIENSDNVDDIQTYDERKKAGVACVRKILSDSKCNSKKISDSPSPGSCTRTPKTPDTPKLFTIITGLWLQFFEKHGKKDDMADSFLQGLSYIIKNHHHRQIQKI